MGIGMYVMLRWWVCVVLRCRYQIMPRWYFLKTPSRRKFPTYIYLIFICILLIYFKVFLRFAIFKVTGRFRIKIKKKSISAACICSYSVNNTRYRGSVTTMYFT